MKLKRLRRGNGVFIYGCFMLLLIYALVIGVIQTYLANAEESVTKFFRYLKCCFLPEIVKVGTKSYSRKECLQAFSKDTAELSNLEILSTNISELLQILISLGG